MPETLAPAIEERVRALVDEHQTELQQLVQLEVDRRLRELVGLELASRNGNGANFQHAGNSQRVANLAGPATDANYSRVNSSAEPSLRRCRHCGETKPLDQYAKHRHVCKSCRADQQARARERRAQAAEQDDAPRPGPVST